MNHCIAINPEPPMRHTDPRVRGVISGLLRKRLGLNVVLTLLSPTLVKGLLAGKQPRTLSLICLKNHEVPADWHEQKRLFDERDAHS